MKKTLLNHLWKMKAYIFSMFIFAFLSTFSTLQTNAANNDFEVTVKNISPSGSETAQLQFTVTNKGNNFEGTAQLVTMENYSAITAFDEDLSLPAEGTKQFVYAIPSNYLDQISASYFKLIDRKGKVVYGNDFSKYLFNKASILSVGILSDNYNNLTYFDLAGKSLGYGYNNYHVGTTEITKANLRSELSALTFLVIDNYHTSALSDDDMALIWEWVDKGGCLIIGTGSKADAVYTDNMAILAGVNISIGQPYYGTNFGQIPSVEFNVNNSNSYFDNMDYLGCMVRSEGDGSITLSHFSFTDFNGLTEDDLNGWTLYDLTEDIIWNSMNYSKLTNQLLHGDYERGTESMFFPILNAKDNKLNFTLVKIVIILYLIVISPALYLVLKKKGKHELYWIAIPVLCLTFILFVFLSGNGLTVRKTKIYSVTIADASGRNASKGALYCYDSHKKEWQLPLKNTVSVIAPVIDQGYYNHDALQLKNSSYDYHVGHSQGELFVGLRPTQPFEEVYFNYIGENQENGELTYDNGIIQNNTGKDFAYVCVMKKSSYQSDFAIYENLAAGESFNMLSVNPLTNDTFSDDLSYTLRNKLSDLFEPNYYNKHKAYDSPHAPALPVLSYGLTTVYENCPEDCIVVMGVTENYYPAVNGNSNEKSYGCLYSVFVQNMGGTYAIY